jgi:uncharacterized protein (DUF4415 family)
MRGKRLQTELARLANRKDADIDYSDIPEQVDWSRAEVGKLYRPPKKTVTIRLDADVLRWLKGFGKGYQTRVNALLRHAMTRVGSGAETSNRRR